MSYLDRPNITKSPSLIVPPAACFLASAAVWGAAQRAVFDRFDVATPTTLRYMGWRVEAASGNVQVGVVKLSGTGLLNYNKVMDSGVIACPTAGDIRTDLGATVLLPGTYAAFLWADNTTFSTRWSGQTALSCMRTVGLVASLASGVPSSGTLAWNSFYFNCSLEGDV